MKNLNRYEEMEMKRNKDAEKRERKERKERRESKNWFRVSADLERANVA